MDQSWPWTSWTGLRRRKQNDSLHAFGNSKVDEWSDYSQDIDRGWSQEVYAVDTWIGIERIFKSARFVPIKSNSLERRGRLASTGSDNKRVVRCVKESGEAASSLSSSTCDKSSHYVEKFLLCVFENLRVGYSRPSYSTIFIPFNTPHPHANL